MNEHDYFEKKHGKWSLLGVPHKGWTCVDIEDLGEPSAICEMCEKQSIRYVHYLKHPDYKDTLRVGCICAGHMEDNLLSARKRDDFMKSRNNKRKGWISSNWKTSSKGNEYIKSEKYIIVMKCRDTYWSALIQSEDKTFEIWSKRKYKTINEAKLAAFDYLTKILSEREV
jgi:hypothetical protein